MQVDFDPSPHLKGFGSKSNLLSAHIVSSASSLGMLSKALKMQPTVLGVTEAPTQPHVT